jgi:hypothetical protein
MEWLNIHRRTVKGEMMQDASASAVRAWLFLTAYCARQENGGRIAGAKGWGERKWLRMTGLAVEEVQQGDGLWHWEGEDLVVEFYQLDQEALVRAKRRAGRAGGRRRAENWKVQSQNTT